jgi:hypothetical protein
MPIGADATTRGPGGSRPGPEKSAPIVGGDAEIADP